MSIIKNNLPKALLSIVIAAVVAGSILTANYFVMAWVAPNAHPPDPAGNLPMTGGPWQENAGDVYYLGGNVGVGTDNPGDKLHVVHNTDTWGGIMVSETGVGGESFRVNHYGGPGSGTQLTQEGNLPIRFNTNNVERMRINGNGDVGVGTNNPGQNLDIVGNMRASGEIIGTRASGHGQFRAISGNYGLIHRNDGDNYYMLLTASGDQYGTWNTLRPFRINNGTGDVYLGNGALFVDHSTGNVGIGTVGPDNKLEVSGGHIEIQNDDMDSKIRFHDPGNYWYSMGIDRSDGGKFKINWGGEIGETDHFVLNTSGNIGIGDASPDGSLKLDVEGQIGATQYCDQNGNNCTAAASLGGVGTPAGAIMQFYLDTCPTGWKPADGTNGTPDLRGAFVRGMETFDAGSTYNNRDDDRSGAATRGSYQDDEFESHVHSEDYWQGTGGGGATPGSANMLALAHLLHNSDATGGAETRPKNVALIFCQKE